MNRCVPCIPVLAEVDGHLLLRDVKRPKQVQDIVADAVGREVGFGTQAAGELQRVAEFVGTLREAPRPGNGAVRGPGL